MSHRGVIIEFHVCQSIHRLLFVEFFFEMIEDDDDFAVSAAFLFRPAASCPPAGHSAVPRANLVIFKHTYVGSLVIFDSRPVSSNNWIWNEPICTRGTILLVPFWYFFPKVLELQRHFKDPFFFSIPALINSGRITSAGLLTFNLERSICGTDVENC